MKNDAPGMTSDPATTQASLANLEDLYPLSPMQQGMLFHSIYAPGSGVYVEQSVFTLTGSFDLAVFERAWQHVVDRHTILRTAFLWEDMETPLQAVQRHVELPIVRHDWREFADRDARLASFLADDRRDGFILSRAPLMRLALIRYADHEYKCVWTRHHLVLDRWSRSLVLKDFLAIYDALSAGLEPALPAARPYGEYVAWLGRQDTAAAERFWKTALAGFDEPTPLELGPIERCDADDGQYVDRRLRLSAADTDKIQAFARQHRLTLNTVVQAAWGLLLARYTGRDDVVFGVSTAGRPADLPGVENIVGLLINTLPLRVRIPSAATVVSWLQDVQESQTTLQQYQYSSLLDIHGWSEIPRSQPLFDSIFIFENLPAGAARRSDAGLQMRSDRGYGSHTNYPLTVLVMPGAELNVQIVFDRSRFDAASVARMLNHFAHLLREIASDAHRRVHAVSLLSEEERQERLTSSNRTYVEYDSETGVDRLFEAQAAKTPAAIAVIADDAENGWTYDELNRRANQLARHLRTLGVGPEVRVGVFLERTADMIVALLGVLKAGGAYVPLDPAYPADRVRHAVRDAALRVIVTQARLLDRQIIDTGNAVCLDRDAALIARQPDGNLDGRIEPGQIAYLIYTSGSTGTPKGVQIPHRALTNFLGAMRAAPGLTVSDVLLSVTTLSFDIAALELYLPLIVGARLVIASQDDASDGRRLRRRLAETGATVMQATPATWRMLIDAGWEGSRGFRALCGGEQLSRELADRILGRVDALWNLYGPTETTIWSAAARVEAGSGPVAIAGPIANTRLYVLDAQLAPVPVGVVGELYIAGDGLARGYWQHPELTAERFVPDPFATRAGERLYRTGDRVRAAADGSMIWLGRVDHQIKLRGFRIELGEIESAIRSHPRVSETVVIVREDVPGDPRLVAYVVARDGDEGGALVPELRGALAARLPRHMMPSAFMVLDAWPLTANGKINRRALPAPDEMRPDLNEAYVPARSDTEKVLAAIWGDVLKVEQIGVHDDFFELGGHSLRAMQVVSRLREHFGIEVPLRLLFERPTVAGLAAAIEAEQGRSATAPGVIRGDGNRDPAAPVPLSFAQQRLWFLSRLEPGSAAYNLPRPLRLRGDLDEAALRQAFNTILARHDVLRGGFNAAGDDPVQVLAPRRDIDLPLIDFAAWPEAQREAEASRLALIDAQQPFDLQRPPLLRVTLIRLAPQDHVLLLNMHHIVSDGWSIGILLRELAESYQAIVDGRSPSLPDLPIQYADFARWQREWLQGAVLDEHVGYWGRQLAGAPPVLDLPVARPRPAVQTTQGALVASSVPPRITRALAELSAREGATLFMTLLAAFQTLLYRYSGQQDFVVGAPIAGRDRAETENLIGFFVNALPLRANLSGDPPFSELLARVKETALGAYAHQALPFERIVEELQPARSLSYPPIFQVMFALQNQPRTTLSLPRLQITAVPQVRESAKFDLTLFMAEHEGGLACRLEYNTDLFDEATATRLLDHFNVLLEGIAMRPQARVRALPLLPAAEREQLLTTWNATDAPWSRDRRLHQLVEAQVERAGEAAAVIADGLATSYSELNRRANQLAHHLRTLGVGPEVLVGIFMNRTVDLIVALLGVLKAGGAYVPLDPAYPRERVRFSLDDAQVAVVLTDTSVRDRLPETRAHVICVDDADEAIARAEAGNPRPTGTPANLAYVIYTSGSTGIPKGVAIAHGSAVALIEWAQQTFTRAELTGVLASTSICFDLSVFEIFVPLSAGGTVVLAADALQLPVVAAGATVTLVNTVPSAMAELVRLGLPSSVQTVNLAGEPLRTELVAEIYRQPSVRRVVDLYGPSEDTTYSTYAVRQPDEPPTIGRPIANTRVYILDEQLAPVPVGVPGEIYLAGAGLARGYLRRPDVTADRFLPDPFGDVPGGRLYRTGDVGRYGADGRIQYLGRLDHQVKIRGYRIELGEIETVIRRHPGIRDAVVVAREDTPGDKRLVAYVVPESSSALIPQVRQSLAERLPQHMMPVAFIALDALPLTANGKVDRRALPTPDALRTNLESAYVEPRTDAERVVASIWREVLKLEQIGVHDDFFQLGGHSLLAMQVISRLRERVRIDLPLRSVFEFPTIAGFAAVVADAQAQPDAAVSSVITRSADAAAADLLANLDQLSDEEVEMLLKQTLTGDGRT